MKPWAVVPAKSFARAKTRLELPAPDRALLARALLAHVLDTLGASSELAGIAVVTDSDEVAALADARSAAVVRDRPDLDRSARPGGLGAIIDGALGEIAALGARAAIVVMADLPELSARDVAALAATLRECPVAVAPDRRDRGTNALGLAPIDVMPTCFGHDDSFRRHLDRARGRELPCAVRRSRGLGFDIDLPDDYRELIAPGR
ncbi:MAG: 2-phospho-L-lactate guanylyltransferase [Myxococcota bacterium]